MNHQNILILLIFFQGIISSYKYLGVERYGSINRTEVLNPDSKIYRFLNKEKNEEQTFRIYPGNISDINETDYDKKKCEDGAYPIQNKLVEGYEYNLTIDNNDNDLIIEVNQTTEVENKYTSPINYTPGLRTLKNFIAAAFQPVGTTLYVFGGGWDFQDVGTSNEGRTNEISVNWVKFFDDQNINYTYRDDDNKDKTYYPFGSFNEYYYAGLDCSGFVGWTIYNNLYNESLKNDGFVMSAKKIAKYLADNNYGKWMHTVEGSSFSNPNYKLLAEELKVGDILSTSGHVMIVLAKCKDDSFIIIHSTPSKSKTNYPGGGVQLSAVNPKKSEDKDCEAYKLCEKYMKKFKKWSERYEAVVIPTETVFNFDDKYNETGIFHWEINEANGGIISDPDKYLNKKANEILEDLFEVRKVKKKGLIIAYVILMGLIVISLAVVIIIALKKTHDKNKEDNNKNEELIEKA